MINYLDYNIDKTFILLREQLRLNSFLSVLVSLILFGFVMFLNKEKKITRYIFIGFNAICIIFILYFYFKGIVSIKYSYPFKNIYVYFLNSLIYLILTIVLNKRIINNKIDLTIYIFIIVGIVYSIYMTFYLKNIVTIVIGNIFPEIFFGNILILLYYIYTLVRKIIERRK